MEITEVYMIFTSAFLLSILMLLKLILDKLTLLEKSGIRCPMKPERLRRHPYDGYVGDCPECKRTVRFAQKYCHNCTQRLDWSDAFDSPPEEDDEDDK